MTELHSLLQTHRAGEIELARTTLTEFMIDRAHRTADEVGFKWIAVPDAPNDYEGLRAAYDVSARLGAPLPISSEHNDDVIYTSAEGNIAFRFVHDVHHIKLGFSFQVIDELELAVWHLDELAAEGFAPDSLPWRMLHADLMGQAHLIALARDFPGDQRRFVTHCLDGGFDRGLVHEARRITKSSAER